MSRDGSTGLEAAYRFTTYVVIRPEGTRLSLRVDQIHPEFDALLKEQGIGRWAFLTACNPRSEQWSVEANCSRMATLRNELTAGGFLIWDGEGVGSAGDWLPEPSFLILGIERADLLLLATQYEQNAFVYGELGHPAELVWTSLAP